MTTPTRMEQHIETLKLMPVGESFRVETPSERMQILQAAKILGIRITTRKGRLGGFTVTRLPEDL